MQNKKLTLNETWKWQLRLSGYIAKEKRAGSITDVFTLKKTWLEKNWRGKQIFGNCFFCQYGIGDCTQCPGIKVNARFGCENRTYHFRYKPIAFYNKLVSLNKKRKKSINAKNKK